MLVSGIDKDANTALNKLLEPAVIKLLEQIAGKPLLLEKLILSSAKPDLLTTDIKNSALLNQIQLPIQLSDSLGKSLQQTDNLQLKLINNKVMLILTSDHAIQGKSAKIDKAFAQTQNIIFFNQANMSNKLLMLSNPITNQIKIKNLIEQAISKNLLTRQNNLLPITLSETPRSDKLTQNSITHNNASSINQAARHFLGNHDSNKPIGHYLQRIFSHLNDFKNSLNMMVNNQKSTELLGQNGLTELLKLTTQLPSNTLSKALFKVFNQFNELTRNFDWSSQNSNVATTSNKLPENGSMKHNPYSQLNKGSQELANIIKQVLNAIKQKPILLSNLVPSTKYDETDETISFILTPSNDKSAKLDESQVLKFAFSAIKSEQLKSFLNQWSQLKLQPHLTAKTEMALYQKQIKLLNDMLGEIALLQGRIENSQIANARQDNTNLQHFFLDLPLLHKGEIDSFELLLQSDKKNKNKTDKLWQITIKFDLQPLGPMFAKVSLRGKNISTHFFAEKAETAKLLEENIGYLKDTLFAAGLQPDAVEGQQGKIPENLINLDRQAMIDLRI